MSNKTEAKEIVFKSDLREAADIVLAGMNIDKDSGVITVKEGLIQQLMPEGQTLESHLAHQRTMDLITNAFTLAGVEKSNEAMVLSKNLEATSFNVPTYGKNYLEGTFKRHGVSRGAPGTDTVTNYVGSVGHSRHETVSTRTKAEVTAIKDHFKAIAAAAEL